MRSRTAAFALVLAALSAGSCTVYDPADLTGPPGAGNGGSPGGGRSGSGAGGSNVQAGAGTGGGGMAGSLGGSGAGNGSGSAGSGALGGEGGEGAEGGESVGGTTTGGTGGTGGTSGGTGGVPQRPEIIDDCDDGNRAIRPYEGRTGAWFTYSDKGTVVPPANMIVMTAHGQNEMGIPPDSERAFRLTVSGSPTQAIAGIDLIAPVGVPPNVTKKIYDASKYQGIRFYAKATLIPPALTRAMTVEFPVAATVDKVGDCDPSQTATTNRCSDHFQGIDNVMLTPAWDQYEVLFENTTQEGWGLNPGLTEITPDKLVSIHFQIVGNGELWIDQVEFIPTE